MIELYLKAIPSYFSIVVFVCTILALFKIVLSSKIYEYFNLLYKEHDDTGYKGDIFIDSRQKILYRLTKFINTYFVMALIFTLFFWFSITIYVSDFVFCEQNELAIFVTGLVIISFRILGSFERGRNIIEIIKNNREKGVI